MTSSLVSPAVTAVPVPTTAAPTARAADPAMPADGFADALRRTLGQFARPVAGASAGTTTRSQGTRTDADSAVGRPGPTAVERSTGRAERRQDDPADQDRRIGDRTDPVTSDDRSTDRADAAADRARVSSDSTEAVASTDRDAATDEADAPADDTAGVDEAGEPGCHLDEATDEPVTGDLASAIAAMLAAAAQINPPVAATATTGGDAADALAPVADPLATSVVAPIAGGAVLEGAPTATGDAAAAASVAPASMATTALLAQMATTADATDGIDAATLAAGPAIAETATAESTETMPDTTVGDPTAGAVDTVAGTTTADLDTTSAAPDVEAPGAAPTDGIAVVADATSAEAGGESLDSGEPGARSDQGVAGRTDAAMPDGSERATSSTTTANAMPVGTTTTTTAAAGAGAAPVIDLRPGATTTQGTAAPDITRVDGVAAPTGTTTTARVVAEAVQPVRIAEAIAPEVARMRGTSSHRTIEIRLDPPDLGSVELEIRSSGSTITVVAVTESADATNAVLRQRDQIEATLRSMGMDLAGFDVSTGDARRDDAETRRTTTSSTTTTATTDDGLDDALSPAPTTPEGSVFL